MADGPDMKELEKRMDGAIASLKSEYAGLRSGRATISLLDPVTVNAYGSEMPLNQVGTVGVPDARTLSVQVWDKGLVSAVEKGIRESGLDLNPVTDGQTVRVPMPPMTEERRRDLAKLTGKYAEAAKVAIRNVRRDGMEEAKKAEGVSEDDQKRMSEEVQKLTDAKVKEIDQMHAQKEKEIMQV
ncbi:putative ribosome recycling factor [Parvularcula bermudensis HTCC2503]|uniref:Ribosome-recycling factor n=1 Tax=Parvularcula bermudensis (strain ATCC BAA-594 / HTCC2503 / KCTC 12087) TaxID=314260 RepID=E0TCI4_PARBH|nr:ribosome recycling factor [Parvularcula bermudensis]ADM08573.1 putative ribosome recycling factor [Parvularcula bermudensis HTCC2503]